MGLLHFVVFTRQQCNASRLNEKAKNLLAPTRGGEQSTSLSGSILKDEGRDVWEGQSWHLASLRGQGELSNKESFQLAKSLISTEKLIRI